MNYKKSRSPGILNYGRREFLKTSVLGGISIFCMPLIYGEELGNYNTQQHWVTHSDELFLVYTRCGANNDHVFRHRAPLFIAQVDPEKLCVIRETERILVPERGARLGNFGVTDISRDETWVTVSEWMQPKGVEKYGSDGSVFVARIHWDKPNKLFVD